MPGHHRHLNRHKAAERLREWGETLVPLHEVPFRIADTQGDKQTMNLNEETLKAMFDMAGFAGYITWLERNGRFMSV